MQVEVRFELEQFVFGLRCSLDTSTSRGWALSRLAHGRCRHGLRHGTAFILDKIRMIIKQDFRNELV